MRFKWCLIGLLILTIAISGCAKEKNGPKKLGYDVARALKNKNFDSYNNLCVNIRDKRLLIYISDLSKAETKEQTSLLLEGREEIERIKNNRAFNFNDLAAMDEWEEAVISRVVLGKRTKVQGVIGYDSIIVKFKQKILPDLEIEKIVKIKENWKILKQDALSFKSRI